MKQGTQFALPVEIGMSLDEVICVQTEELQRLPGH